METIPTRQAMVLAAILVWISFARWTNLAIRIRSHTQPFVIKHVHKGIPLVLRVQNMKRPFLDAIFAFVSCMVSTEFYTGFLPLLFWSGHCKLARQMTLLMAFCTYVGNCIKDAISAPRPPSPPVRRLTVTDGEKEYALEYGLPSSHTLNTICLSGYLLHYVVNYYNGMDGSVLKFLAILLVCLLAVLIGIARMYLGMHTLIDVIGGAVIGTIILSFWLTVHESIDKFIVSGKSVTSFWASLSLLLLFSYPVPELHTPSFEFHTAFNGVALGVVTGIQRTFEQFHHEDVPRIFGPDLGIMIFVRRIMVGLPTIIAVKVCSKALAKLLLPLICNLMGVSIKSSCYLQPIKGATYSTEKNHDVGQLSDSNRQSGYLQRFFLSFPEEFYDVDTGIRLFQYAGLGWSVVELVPWVFKSMRL